MKKSFVLALFFTVISVAQYDAQTREEAVKKTLNERFESAEADMKTLIEREPTNGDHYFAAGDNYLYWGEHQSEAETMYRKGIEVAPTNPLNYAGLGRLAWMKKDEAMANAQFAKAVEIMNTKSNKTDKTIKQMAYLKMAEVLLQPDNQKLDKAIEYINAALTINDKNPEVYIQLGDYYSLRDGINLSNAVMQYNKALEIDPTFLRANLRKGVLYTKVESYDEALNFYETAIGIDPTFAPAYREKAELLYKAQRYPAAIENYAKYLELNKSCRVEQRYASFVFLTKDYKKAITALEEALPCDPNNGFMYRLLGYSYYETGDFAKGMENMDKFFDIATKNGKPTILGSDYGYKGKLLSKSGQDSLALDVLKMAVEKDQEYIDGYAEIAAIYFKQKKYGDAAQYYQLKVDKSKEPSQLDYYYVGQARYFNKEYAIADEAFSKAISKYPDANFWRGRCNHKQEINPDEPVGLAKPYHEAYIKAVGTDPKRIEANKKNLIESYGYLGVLYGKQKNYDCSKAAWTKVLELDPAHKIANDVMLDENIKAAPGTCVLIPVE
ncbi:MAG: tetratricopeptide repeat protein [Flavobacteriales bacterium]|nr:tetratricopeptide repeat protein [Flavobacteriales bacterium]